MGIDYRKEFETKTTPQSEQADPRQVQNAEGAYVFQADDWSRLERFLILGSDGGTYYVGQRELTRDNAEVVLRCLGKDAVKTIGTIVDISTSGRAPKNDPAIFALAMCSTHTLALSALPEVCRIGTHLFQYLHYVEGFRGWGRGLRTAVARWYEEREADQLAYQVAKYQNRHGYTHWDALRLSHPKATTGEHAAIYDWICTKYSSKPRPLTPEQEVFASQNLEGIAAGEVPVSVDRSAIPGIIVGMDKANHATDGATWAHLVREHGLTREMLPTEALKSNEVWEALLEKMPLTAMIRNLGNMTKSGLIAPMSDAAKLVAEKLRDQDNLRKSRVHPLSVLVANVIYTSGQGMRGSNTWSPDETVMGALDDAFYLAFGNVEASGKNTMLAIDVSSSMTWTGIAGMPLSPNQVSAAMAMVTARVEGNYMIRGFAHTLRDLGITANDSLKDVMRRTQDQSFGGTDCALPMLEAIKNKWEIDTFIVYTDNQTWAGHVHPHQALEQYRQFSGRNAKLIVVGMTTEGFTIANPDDPGMLDVVGFDTATPNVMAAFAA